MAADRSARLWTVCACVLECGSELRNEDANIGLMSTRATLTHAFQIVPFVQHKHVTVAAAVNRSDELTQRIFSSASFVNSIPLSIRLCECGKKVVYPSLCPCQSAIGASPSFAAARHCCPCVQSPPPHTERRNKQRISSVQHIAPIISRRGSHSISSRECRNACQRWKFLLCDFASRVQIFHLR